MLTTGKEWQKEELDFIKENYEKMSTREIGNCLGRTQSSVENKKTRMGLKNGRKYNLNVDFFKLPLNEFSAYWLGFISADGYVSQDGKEVSIELKKDDYEHLKKFNKHLQGNMEVRYRTKNPRYIKGRYTGQSELCEITVYSKPLVFDLNSLGIFPKKSLIIEFQDLKDDNLTWAYLRGFFDGDGTVYYDKRSNQLRCKISCASPLFIEGFQNFLNKFNIKTYKDGDGCGITGKECTKIFLSKMYDNANVYLNRKYKKYQNYKYLFGFNRQ